MSLPCHVAASISGHYPLVFSSPPPLSKKSKLVLRRRLRPLNNTENAHSILKPLCRHRRPMRRTVGGPGLLSCDFILVQVGVVVSLSYVEYVSCLE